MQPDRSDRTHSAIKSFSAAFVTLGALALGGCRDAGQPSAAPGAASSMQLTSTAFTDGQTIPEQFTCDGAGRSPPLQWHSPPSGTLSFALVVEDPDAPGGTFRHWGVYDLPMSARQLDTGAAQSGESDLKQTENDFGKAGYGPPCPPKGDRPHHYHFRMLALDEAKLSGAPSKVKDILKAGDGHVLGSAELVGLYGRK